MHNKNTKKQLNRFKQLRLKALKKKFFLLKRRLKTFLKAFLKTFLKHYLKHSSDQYRIKLLQFMQTLLLIILALLFFPTIAFADDSSEIKFAVGLAAAGVVTVTAFIMGTRYIILGDSVSNMTSNLTSTVSGTVKKLDNIIIKYIGEQSSSSEEAGSSKNIQPEITQGQIELTADRILNKLGKCMDERVDRLNPLTHAQGAQEKLAAFIKKVLSNRNNEKNQWATNLERKVNLLGSDKEIQIETGMQKLMKDLDKKGADLEEALKTLTTEDLELFAEYAIVSVSRANSAAGEHAAPASAEMASVLEPLLFSMGEVTQAGYILVLLAFNYLVLRWGFPLQLLWFRYFIWRPYIAVYYYKLMYSYKLVKVSLTNNCSN